MTSHEKADTTDLLPCPFCGWDALVVSGGPGNHFVQCTGCRATSDDCLRESAIAAWNRRTPAPSPDTTEAASAAAEPVACKHVTPWSYDEHEGDYLDAGGHMIGLHDDDVVAFVLAKVNAQPLLNPPAVTEAMVEALTDEKLRWIAESKDVGTCRGRIRAALQSRATP